MAFLDVVGSAGRVAAVGAVAVGGVGGVGVGEACGQADMPSKVPIAFNRYRTREEMGSSLQQIAEAYPDLATVVSIGKSLKGNDLWVLVVNPQKTGSDLAKPAMWIDGAVHANELQAAEAVLYTGWYLTKAYGVNKDLTALMDRTTFYLMPMVNPDGRDAWFAGPSTPHSSRHNLRPVDEDRDGLFDEDGPDDLDGDGELTSMWKQDPLGRWERDRNDPRIFRRLADDKPAGGWTRLGEEGIDNDGDGLVNEDEPGGDDMNRNWPAGWLPQFAQWGAGEYPLADPETRSIAAFIASRPNIAAVQSYHNAGGMILRGPGAPFREWAYPREDVGVYEEIAKAGEKLLPYYRSMVIHKDLYTVHGGFVNWTAESLGVFSFTNELWTEGKYFQRESPGGGPGVEDMWFWRDKMVFGQNFVPYKEVEHLKYGTVLVGGLNRWASRTTPTFMLEEECHRNFAFTMLHAGEMPKVVVERTEVKKVGEMWEVKVALRNEKLIPTRSRHAANRKIGLPDLLTATVEESGGKGKGGGGVVASGWAENWLDEKTRFVDREPGRVLVNEGVPGRSGVVWRAYVTGPEGATMKVRYEGEKFKAVEVEVVLKAQ